MPPSFFPLRWESTGDQWWYASPIDFAAANGQYDLVRELLHLDSNLLIKLTSRRRIHRLETVWDDEEQFNDVAKCRSEVAWKLLLECEPKKKGHGHNSLIRAGYGGWLLYTAASAGDVSFVKELLSRDPLLVFGEGEYGVTDILYAASRSKNSEVFRVLLQYSVWSKGEEIGSVFKMEMINRAVHAAARGGNVEILKELLGDNCDVLSYKDVQGSTLLHSASGRGQNEVVKYLLESYDIVHTTDIQGNTALHIAAYNGHLQTVEILISSFPTFITSTNNHGDTFLHMTVAGFQTPGFHRVDRQVDLMKQLVSGKIVNMEDIINLKNNDGRTPLHLAVIENIHSDVVELLMSVRSIDLNIQDVDRMTPLDLLRQRPKSASSEILIKRLISAGGISNHEDYTTRTMLASHLMRTLSIGGSPGTSFTVPDGEIIFFTGVDEYKSIENNVMYSGDLAQYDSPVRSNSGDNDRKQRLGSASSAARKLKRVFGWSRVKEQDDCDSLDSYSVSKDKLESSPIPLRERFSKSSLLNHKRVLAPSPSTRKKFSAGLRHGVLQVNAVHSPSSLFSESSCSSPVSVEDDDKVKYTNVGNMNQNHRRSGSNSWINNEKPKMHRRQSSLSRILMNQYFCFGAQGLAVDEPVSRTNPH